MNARTGSGISTADGMVVQLYASSSGALGTFMPVPGSIVQVGILAPGYFDAGVVRIPASIIAPGAGAFLELRGWETAFGATFEGVVCGAPMGGRLGLAFLSLPFRVNSTGNPLASPPEDPVDLGRLIPETGIHLGGLTPLYRIPTNQTVQCSGPEGALVTYTTSAIDLCGDDSAGVSCQPPSGSTFPLGVTIVSCTVTNSGGHTIFYPFFTVNVEDSTALTIAPQADSVVLDWRPTCGSYVLEQTESLSPPVEWTPVLPITRSDATNSVTLPITGASRFYRFQAP